MATGDPYFTCDNSVQSFEQVFRMMVSQDANGKPIFSINNGAIPSGNYRITEDNQLRILENNDLRLL